MKNIYKGLAGAALILIVAAVTKSMALARTYRSASSPPFQALPRCGSLAARREAAIGARNDFRFAFLYYQTVSWRCRIVCNWRARADVCVEV